MIPSTPIGFLYLFLAAIIAGFGWTLGSRLASRL